jgi:BCD family chlorophyll transporter-like MFS transporter
MTARALPTAAGDGYIGWPGIFRLGLVQMALGAIVVLTTSTLNRVMVVELAVPAMLPGALVALHYAMQMLRPRMGHGSDVGQRRTPWIVGGMAVLAAGGAIAAVATVLMGLSFAPGVALAVFAFVLIGGGVSASGTSLLVLLAKRVHTDRRAAAATVVWIMMIAGFAITATIAGKLLDPYSSVRLIAVTSGVSAFAFVLALVAIWGVEGHAAAATADGTRPVHAFRDSLREVWQERDARNFTIFVFISMLAYSGQDLILEPFAGALFAFTPGESTKLSGVQHGGVLAGMILVAFATSVLGRWQFGSLKAWIIGGCLASGLALAGLAYGGVVGPPWPLRENVFLLGVANGAFSIAAIASMMAMASRGLAGREGVRMGLWGASQAIAFGAGGFLGTVLSDVAKWLTASPSAGYSMVFALEALAFVVASLIACNIELASGNRRARTVADEGQRSAGEPLTGLAHLHVSKGSD